MTRAFLLVAVFLITLSGCDLFSTRTPEPPNTTNTFIWTPATTPTYLLQNFTGTLQSLDAPDYIRAFIGTTDSTSSGTKSFSFVPAPGLDQTSRSIFTNWTVESERAWLSRLSSLLPAKSQLTVLLSNEVTDETGSTTASISADYTISIPTSSSTVLPSVVQGSFQMQLALVTTEQGTKEWRIVSWSDFLPKSGTGPTWTDLKVKLSS